MSIAARFGGFGDRLYRRASPGRFRNQHIRAKQLADLRFVKKRVRDGGSRLTVGIGEEERDPKHRRVWTRSLAKRVLARHGPSRVVRYGDTGARQFFSQQIADARRVSQRTFEAFEAYHSRRLLVEKVRRHGSLRKLLHNLGQRQRRIGRYRRAAGD